MFQFFVPLMNGIMCALQTMLDIAPAICLEWNLIWVWPFNFHTQTSGCHGHTWFMTLIRTCTSLHTYLSNHFPPVLWSLYYAVIPPSLPIPQSQPSWLAGPRWHDSSTGISLSWFSRYTETVWSCACVAPFILWKKFLTSKTKSLMAEESLLQ